MARGKALKERGERLRQLRLDRGVASAAALAEGIGKHPRTVEAWEAGKTEMNPANAALVAAFLGVPVEDVTGVQTPAPVLPATDQAVRDSFAQASRRISALEEAIGATAESGLRAEVAALSSVLNDVLLAVEELQLQTEAAASPGTGETAKRAPRTKLDRPGR